LVPCCQAYNIGVIPYTPLASGFLTGKYKFGVAPSSDYRLSMFSSEDGIKAGPGDVFTESSYKIVTWLESFAQERGHTVAELAIAWLLSHPWISTVIAGAKNVEQVSANAKAGDWKLTEDEVAKIEDIFSGT
jgi:aryl-alcohol dehydrogenase-like predicted oxidoreductase